MTEDGRNRQRIGSARAWRRLLPLLLFGLAIGAVFAFDLDRFLSFQALQRHRTALQDFVASHGMAAAFAYMLVYAAATAMSLPGGAMLTVAGGFLFGTVSATVYAALGATIGAIAVFLIARSALGGAMRARAGSVLQRMEAGFQASAFSYLLFLRLIPLFPFVLVNIVPALLGVPLRIYVVATAIGILPGCFVYATLGTGLGSVLDSGETFSPAAALTPEVLAALAGLAVLALLPAAYKAIARRKH
ncbi:MAG: TVP38/TMEM64 family protein [Alphaproteobacteria bacterium]